jgi:anaerobic selenocysteine-containing dehydrogenase
MGRRPPRKDIDESDLKVTGPAESVAGVTGAGVAIKRAVEQMGVRRATRALTRLNQADGFDCHGCAWPDPDPDHRHTAEFCENGAKAVAEEATLPRVDADFFGAHPIGELADRTDHWLGQHGRITDPVVLRPNDIRDLGFADGDVVDQVGEWRDEERAARAFRIVADDQPRGRAAAYYPETNSLVPLDSTAEGSNTPTSKSVIVRLEGSTS